MKVSFINIFILFIFIFGCIGCLLLHGVFSLVAVSRGYSMLRCAGFSLGGFSCCRAWALGVWASVLVAFRLSSCGLRALDTSSVVVAHGLSCSAACGIFPRTQTRVPCTDRRIPNHCATREALTVSLKTEDDSGPKSKELGSHNSILITMKKLNKPKNQHSPWIHHGADYSLPNWRADRQVQKITTYLAETSAGTSAKVGKPKM